MSKNIVYVFIDASNVWEIFKSKKKFLNWEKVIKYINSKFKATSIKIYYYTSYPADGTRSYDLVKKHNFFVYLKKSLVFIVRKKALKRIYITDDEQGESIKEKGNMVVEMAIDAVHNINKYDIAIFFSGDSDFLSLINYIQNHNKKVFVLSSKNNISRELRTGSNGYTDILKIEDNIWGADLKHRSSQK